jgi:hypothetical protein
VGVFYSYLYPQGKRKNSKDMKLAEKIDRYELMFLQGYIPKEYDTKANYNDYLHLCEFGIDATEYFIELYNKQSNR